MPTKWGMQFYAFNLISFVKIGHDALAITCAWIM